MIKKIYYIIILCSMLSACKNGSKYSPTELFSKQQDLMEVECFFNEDSLSLVEAIQSNDSSLIIFDYHSGYSFSVFDLPTGNFIGRFGEIGQGPGEIPLGCYGYLNNTDFYINYDHTGFVAKYPMDSLLANIRYKPLTLTKYEIPEAQFSRVLPINDTLFVGAGAYQSKFQFVLFNQANQVVDYDVVIFNSEDNDYNKYHKYLANQGIFKKHPGQNKFIYSINYSSNIDFIEILDSKIKIIKSLRLRDPVVKPLKDGDMNRILPDIDNSIGYIDISTDEKYVYALYTDKKLVEDGKGNDFSSNMILVFDWDGNPVKMLKLNHEAYYITVNERVKRVYAVVKNKDGGWGITLYNIDNL